VLIIGNGKTDICKQFVNIDKDLDKMRQLSSSQRDPQ